MTESLHTATLHGDFRAPGTDSKRHRAQVEKWKHTSSHDPDIPITTKPRPVKRAPLYRVPVPSRPEALHLVRLECADQTRLDSIGALDVGGGVTEGDEGVLYNFDVDVSPASSLGLDSLVGRAEAHFVARETEKIVRAEYEVLDGEGETLRRRGKRSPRVEARGVEDVDGDWEAI